MNKKPRLKKVLKRTFLIFSVFLLISFIALLIYSRNPYKVLDEMDTNISYLDLTYVTVHEDRDEIRYTVENPIKQIVFIPGGLVEAESYKYLAASLAEAGYNVTIFKAFFHLAIFTPNYASKFLSEDLENVVIGHSLGGVVGSMVASDNDLVDYVILLGSYPIQDLTDKQVLFITAEHDLGMDPVSFDDSLVLVDNETEIFNIEGGNHAQFGWYGPQKGDGEAEISTLEQQLIVVSKILEFIQN